MSVFVIVMVVLVDWLLVSTNNVVDIDVICVFESFFLYLDIHLLVKFILFYMVYIYKNKNIQAET